MAEHETMIVALTRRDGDGLARAMREHIANTWPRVSSTVAGPDEPV